MKIKRRTIKILKATALAFIVTSGASFGSIIGISLGKGITPERTTELLIAEVQTCNASDEHWMKCYF
jgi:hypothetical protein